MGLGSFEKIYVLLSFFLSMPGLWPQRIWTLAHKICLQSLPLGKDYDAAERRGRPVEGDAVGGIERRRGLCNFVSVLIVDEENEQKERGEKGLHWRVEKGEGAYAIRSCGS